MTTGLRPRAHPSVRSADQSAAALQEAPEYDLAQSLFSQLRNLVLEGLTDYWYVEAVAALLRDAGVAILNSKIALIPASTAGKVVYYATILHAHNLKVAALLDSDNAGDQAANQDVLVHRLGHKRILRTKDFIEGGIAKPEIEDTLRDTLATVAARDLGWNIGSDATSQPSRPIVDIFEGAIKDFSKYRLAKAFLRWTRDHSAYDLSDTERQQWIGLIGAINAALR